MEIALFILILIQIILFICAYSYLDSRLDEMSKRSVCMDSYLINKDYIQGSITDVKGTIEHLTDRHKRVYKDLASLYDYLNLETLDNVVVKKSKKNSRPIRNY